MTQPPHHLFHTGFINSVKQGWFGSIMMSQHTSKNSNQMIKGKKKQNTSGSYQNIIQAKNRVYKTQIFFWSFVHFCLCSSYLLFRGSKVTSKWHLTCCRERKRTSISPLETFKIEVVVLWKFIKLWMDVWREADVPSAPGCSCSGPGLQSWDTWFFPGWRRSWSWSRWSPAEQQTRGILASRGAVTSRCCYGVTDGTWDWAALMEMSLNIFLLLWLVLNIFTACWAASCTSTDSGLLSNQPPSGGTFSEFDKHFRKQLWGLG